LATAGSVSAPLPAIAADETRNGSGVEVVVVTAERRMVDLQKTTLAATVLSADDLKNKSVINLASLQSAAPGITINDYGSANVFNMRGVGREAVDVEIPSGIAIYRDGVPTLAGYFQGEPYFDMESVEVLRGPQGTFAGQSASGGALFIRTRNPDLNGVSGHVQGGLADYDQHEIEGAMNIPLASDFAMRVALNHLDRTDTWYKLSGTFTGHPGTREIDDGRISFFWQPSESFDVVWKTDIARLDYGGNPVSVPGGSLFTITLNDPMEYVDKSVRSIVDMKYHFADGITLRSLTGFQNVSTVNNLDANGGIPDQASFKSQGNFFFYSEEVNLLSSENESFRWVLGLFAEKQHGRIPDFNKTGQDGFTFTGFGFPPAPALANFPFFTTPWVQNEEDLAVFGSVQYDFTPEWTVEAGTRFSYNHKESFTKFTFGDGVTIPPIIPFLDPAAGINETASGDYVDGKIALQWKPTPDDFAYIQAARGHTVKGINIFPPHDQYKPVEVWDYEIGWKTSWFDEQLRTQIDAYYEDIGNYQAVFGTFGGLIFNGSETRNAQSRSRIWGIEASGQGTFGDLSLDFGAAYLNSRIGDFINVINPFGPPPLGNAVANAEAISLGATNCHTASPTLDLTGAKAPFSPDFTANIGAQYAAHLGGGWTLTPRADLSYADANQADLFACSLETIKSRTLLNLQMRIENADTPWWASLWATNVSDYHYVVAVQNIPPIYYSGAPLQFGLRVGRSF
jgi:iron complex outermembrane receptor protein